MLLLAFAVTDGQGTVRASGITRAMTGPIFPGVGDTFETDSRSPFRNGFVKFGDEVA